MEIKTCANPMCKAVLTRQEIEDVGMYCYVCDKIQGDFEDGFTISNNDIADWSLAEK